MNNSSLANITSVFPRRLWCYLLDFLDNKSFKQTLLVNKSWHNVSFGHSRHTTQRKKVLKRKLKERMNNLLRKGIFLRCVTAKGVLPPAPGVSLEAIGEIKFPLSEEEFEKVKEKKGGKGVVKIGAKEIEMRNGEWEIGIKEIIRTARVEVGAKELKGKLKEMVLIGRGERYEVETKDEQKEGERGKIVRVIIQMPSKFEGGRFKLTRRGNRGGTEEEGKCWTHLGESNQREFECHILVFGGDFE